MKKYVTKGGEMIDEICHAHYGNDSQFENVLRVNHGIEKLPFRLPAGQVVLLPDEKVTETKGVTLW